MSTNPQQDRGGFPTLDIKAARALNPHTRTIQIQSILGGHSQFSDFGSADQFQTSLAIDPSLTIGDISTPSAYSVVPSGILRPAPCRVWESNQSMSNTPMWIKSNPKTSNYFAYDASGSTFSTLNILLPSQPLSDGGSMSSATGNGMAYYDNYMYFAKNTDIARYGPLNGSPSFDGTYWTSTLSKTALTNTTYPLNKWLSLYHSNTVRYPNHVMHRHSDGKLYIADVVGNQGVLHIISTTKTTVEGDTDNGSTYQKLTFGYGLWPTSIESYGSQLVIGLLENAAVSDTADENRGERGKIAFWDTTSQNFNSITWVEYPDALISSITNADGTLYITSGSLNAFGFRLMRYVGGNSFKEVTSFYDSAPPFAGGVDADSNQLIFGGATLRPETAGIVYSYGLPKNLSQGIFSIMRVPTSYSNNPSVTAVTLEDTAVYGGVKSPVAGFSQGTGSTNNSIMFRFLGNDNLYYDLAPQVWWSQKFKIGQPFKITKLRISMARAVTSSHIVTPIIHTDDAAGTTYTGGSDPGLQIINSTNYLGKKNIVMRPQGLTGDHNFWLELRWTGDGPAPVSLPITIEYELISD